MPRIFDNIEEPLLPSLLKTLSISERADFCVGYFNLRGWKSIDTPIDQWHGGPGQQCRLLVGMQRLPQDELRSAYTLLLQEDQTNNQEILRLKQSLAQEFRNQLKIGVPTDADEAGLRRLSMQLKTGKLVVKLHLRHTLHAKLYLCFRNDFNNPATGFIGSSNLTLSGLSVQGELNVDVIDHDPVNKLSKWFNDRWADKWCLDITKELIQVIDTSWAREECPPPYYIYVKMAYHLAEEARAGLSEFSISANMRGVLLEFQAAAVRIAAKHLEKRGGVILGDVVGLGKTLMATALARLFQEPPHFLETLILCPKNLVGMWKNYATRYRLIAEVVPVTQATNLLPQMRRFRIVIIDESHNLRNREGRRWAAIHDYITRNASKCILLSATPYNKTYLDLANQLRLFLDPEHNVGIRPEEYLREVCKTPDEFTRLHQCPLNCLAAFEKSDRSNDWRELMRLYMVRRTRSFIERNYALIECPTCHTIVPSACEACPNCARPKIKTDRRFLILDGNTRFHFPRRRPKTVHFSIRAQHGDDQYAKLYSDQVVDTVRKLRLPRYGLANYLVIMPNIAPTGEESAVINNLSRAGKRLIGFCRTNLFKRLESSGHSFVLSVRRHIVRNFIVLYALEQGLPIPIGTQDAALFDTKRDDRDSDSDNHGRDDAEPAVVEPTEITAQSLSDFTRAGANGYHRLQGEHVKNFAWLRADLFSTELANDLLDDANSLLSILQLTGDWCPSTDAKLAALEQLLIKTHPQDKIIVFSQFADTVDYIGQQLQARGVQKFAAVTGDADAPADFVRRFSPRANQIAELEPVTSVDELRILIATDVLSEGQNLQDGAIVVNYDLPWAIIRLIQRVGRVDRIGQRAEEILCYSFLPADGVERIIQLRSRVNQRLQENAEVVGTDEAFFEDEQHNNTMHDLFTEKLGVLDDLEDNEVDLASLAYQIWKNACDIQPQLKKIIPDMDNVVFSTKALATVASRSINAGTAKPEAGAMLYMRTADGNDALAWVNEHGSTITESQHEILRAAACLPTTPALPRLPNHHTLVQQAVAIIQHEQATSGGQLGKPTSIRRRIYERLKEYAKEDSLFDPKQLLQALDRIYDNPLTEVARELLQRELRSGVAMERLAELVLVLHEENRLCVSKDYLDTHEPQVICSLGIRGALS